MLNYSALCERELQSLNNTPRLLLHSCCAPCSSYVLEYLTRYFDITLLYYNPNIDLKSEFLHRADELLRLVAQQPHENPVNAVVCDYNSNEFYRAVAGLENEPEGGRRCVKCFELRLGYAAEYAAKNGYDYLCSTLTISPLKNAARLNEIGESIANKAGVRWLYSDFKKKEGFKRSIELSAQYELYRQSYCGCKFSKQNNNRSAQK